MKRMTIYTLLILGLLTMFGLSSAHAQVGSAVVTANATFSISTSDVVTVKAQITSCGNGQLPLYNGVPISLTPNQTFSAPFTVTNTGNAQIVTFTVPGNDKIICGGQAYSQYAFTWYDNGFPVAPTQNFRFIDATSQTLSNLAPISFTPPVLNNAAGALCPANLPVFSGFDKNYHIICGVAGTVASMPITGGTFLGPIFAPAINGEVTAGTLNYSTLQSAVNAAAASSGSVLIPPSYTAHDLFNSNSSGVHINDQRPLSNSFTPIRTVYASDFGALCNGTTDDTAAVQAALNTANYAYNLPLTTLQAVDVVLPQGSCLILHTLTMGVHGSLSGSGDATYLVADYAAWQGSNFDLIEITTNGQLPGGASDNNRHISNLTLLGISNSSVVSTAIEVDNKANVYGSQYAFPNLMFDKLFVSGFDTAFELQDMRDSAMEQVVVADVRVGVDFNGNVNNFQIGDSTISFSSWDSTSNHSASVGINVVPNTKYQSGSNICLVNLFCAPQGIIVHDSTNEGFDYGFYVTQCIECNFHHNNVDECGDDSAGGADGPGTCFFLGQYSIGPMWITDNWIATANATGNGIYSNANTTNIAAGLWIKDNRFWGYTAPGSTLGVAMVGTSSGALQFVHIDGNTFYNFNTGIYLSQALTNSTIKDNSGSALTSSLINLAGVTSLNHAQLYIDGNADPIDNVPVVNEGSATGYRLGYNISGSSQSAPHQLTGIQTATSAGCTITSPAVGVSCNATITLPITYPDSTYIVLGCGVVGDTGPVFLGDTFSLTDSTFGVREIAASNASTGGGTITCSVLHR